MNNENKPSVIAELTAALASMAERAVAAEAEAEQYKKRSGEWYQFFTSKDKELRDTQAELQKARKALETMDGITKQTRRKSYDGIRTRSGERCKLILETLGNRSMTVEEITDELVAAGHLKYYDRNFVAPRLTELKGAGVLEVVGKKPSKRTGKNTAVWAAVRR